MQIGNSRRCLGHCILLTVISVVSSATVSIAQTTAAKPTVEIDIFPEYIVLGETDTVEVRVRVTRPSGPLQCEAIRIHSNTGEMSPLIGIEDGVYQSTLHLPEDFFPRFALIAAVGTCGGLAVEGYTVVPLYGTGEVELKAKPYSEVTLRIGDSVFGPKRTNDRGKARIPIVVPPGYSYGIAGDKTVDLNLPSVNRIVAIADRTTIKAGDEGRTIIWIFAIDEKGQPLSGGTLRLSQDKGTTTSAEAITPGVYRAYYTGPTLIGDQRGTISIAISDDPISTDEVSFDFTPGAPAGIRILTSAPYFQAGTKGDISVSIAVVDQYGNPTGAPVSLTADFGALSPLSKGEHGSFTATLVVPDFFERRTQALLSARGAGEDAETLSLEKRFPLKAGPPAEIDIDRPEAAVPADGYTPLMLPTRVLDAFGNPVIGETLTLSASEGTVPASVETTAETVIPFTPPLGKRSGTSRIDARIADISESTTLHLTNRTYLFSVTPRIGYINNFGNLSEAFFGVAVDQNLWFILSGLHVSLELDYYYSKEKYESPSGDDRYKSGFHLLPFYFSVGYRYWIIPKLYLAIAGGIGTHIIIHKMAYSDDLTQSTSAAQLGGQGALEAGYLIGPGHIILRLGYMYSKSKKIKQLSGNTGGLTIMLGYRFAFL